MNTDRIEKTILLKAPRERVWQALVDSGQFGEWFGVRFTAPFAPGVHMTGVIVGTTVNADVAKMQIKYATRPFEMTIEAIEPERLFSFRWHPSAHDAAFNYAVEPTTLIEFTLAETEAGTQLTVVESGFDKIPLDRRAQAFTSNSNGWAIMIPLIEGYIAPAN